MTPADGPKRSYPRSPNNPTTHLVELEARRTVQRSASRGLAGGETRAVVVVQCCQDVRVARRTQRAHIRPVSLPGKQQHAGNKWLLCARVPNRGDVTNDHSAGQLLPRKPPTARLLRRGTRLRPRVRLPRPSSRRQRGLVGLFAVGGGGKMAQQPTERFSTVRAVPGKGTGVAHGNIANGRRQRAGPAASAPVPPWRAGLRGAGTRRFRSVMRRWQLPGPTGPFQPQMGQSGHSEPFLATQKGSETHNKHCAQ